MEFEYRPIQLWPGPFTRDRKRAKFRASYHDTLGLLDRELRHLRAKQIVLQLALTEKDIRLDGRPRADARPSHPGIILSFESKHGPLSYPCDSYTSWEDNLRAIALALEALRAVDRYGVTRRAEQYKGWTQLPPPDGSLPPMSAAEAIAVLSRHSPGPFQCREDMEIAYRKAVLATHPDRGGDRGEFERVRRARDVLEKTL